MRKIAIQGELGSNSHMAALAMLATPPGILPCNVSADVFEALDSGAAEAAVLPIENSLHGSVAEHYDLLLANPVRIDSESLLRIRHNVMAAPGVGLQSIRTVLSHPVALAQCRRWLQQHPALRAVPFYDTAGAVKHIMANHLVDTAALAPELAGITYGAELLVPGIEDHVANFTRFHLLSPAGSPTLSGGVPDKLSVAFAITHQPGTLVSALGRLASAGVDLLKIESRPVPGKPWEYVFFVDFRFDDAAMADAALAALAPVCVFVKELGRYRAAVTP